MLAATALRVCSVLTLLASRVVSLFIVSKSQVLICPTFMRKPIKSHLIIYDYNHKDTFHTTGLQLALVSAEDR